MLREFGVKGVQVQEVMSLDDEGVSYLEYGLFSSFLYEIKSYQFFEQETYLWLDIPLPLAGGRFRKAGGQLSGRPLVCKSG